jgi:hypothetical protein
MPLLPFTLQHQYLPLHAAHLPCCPASACPPTGRHSSASACACAGEEPWRREAAFTWAVNDEPDMSATAVNNIRRVQRDYNRRYIRVNGRVGGRGWGWGWVGLFMILGCMARYLAREPRVSHPILCAPGCLAHGCDVSRLRLRRRSGWMQSLASRRLRAPTRQRGCPPQPTGQTGAAVQVYGSSRRRQHLVWATAAAIPALPGMHLGPRDCSPRGRSHYCPAAGQAGFNWIAHVAADAVGW